MLLVFCTCYSQCHYMLKYILVKLCGRKRIVLGIMQKIISDALDEKQTEAGRIFDVLSYFLQSFCYCFHTHFREVIVQILSSRYLLPEGTVYSYLRWLIFSHLNQSGTEATLQSVSDWMYIFYFLSAIEIDCQRYPFIHVFRTLFKII